MRSTLWWLGLVFGVLSLVMLVKQGFDYSFLRPLQLVLDYYERSMQLLLGWAEPWIRQQLSALGAWLRLDLRLNSHWRHVFVLMWLYFGANARTNWNLGRPHFAIFTVMWGGIVALVASLASGTISRHDHVADLLFVAFPIAGLVVFELGRGVWRAIFKVSVSSYFTETNSRWQDFGHHLRAYVLPISSCGAATLLIGFFWEELDAQISGIRQYPIRLTCPKGSRRCGGLYCLEHRT